MLSEYCLNLGFIGDCCLRFGLRRHCKFFLIKSVLELSLFPSVLNWQAYFHGLVDKTMELFINWNTQSCSPCAYMRLSPKIDILCSLRACCHRGYKFGMLLWIIFPAHLFKFLLLIPECSSRKVVWSHLKRKQRLTRGL